MQSFLKKHIDAMLHKYRLNAILWKNCLCLQVLSKPCAGSL